MARRALELRSWPGMAAATIVAAVVLGPLLAVALRAEAASGLDGSDWAAIRFTVLQAAISALISVALAVPVARALSRRQFPGRRVFITLLGAPFILPAIVAVFGLLAVFGRSGLLNTILGHLGLPAMSIYGLHGVVLAHVFFNLPLATRLILQGWNTIPAERFRLAAQLGFTDRDVFRVLERPMLARVLPGAAAVIFALCMSSFAVALTLGGGPRATTIELAIYQAFRFDFDLGRAAWLACVQLLLAGAAAFVAWRVSGRDGLGTGLDRPLRRWDSGGAALVGFDLLAITVAMLLLMAPLAMVVARGLPGIADMPISVWRAAGISVAVALGTTAILLCLALPIAVAASARRTGWLEALGLLGIAVSPLVMGTGLFLLIYPVADPFALAFVVTALVNAVSALPFALRVLVPETRDVVQAYGRLSANLGLGRLTWLRLVLLPRLRGSLGFAMGLTAALSMGDLGVIALFAGPEAATLPLQMYRLMGSYRMEGAAGAALLLLAMSLALFWVFDRWGRARA